MACTDHEPENRCEAYRTESLSICILRINIKNEGLLTLLERLHSGEKPQLVVANKDRLARFGFELIQWMAQQNGGEVLVPNDTGASPKEELTQDILSILDTFSDRLYGLRRYRQAIKEDKSLSSE